MEEKFELTEKRQDAVFLTTRGWTGGMGDPVLDPATERIRYFNDLPIYVNSDELDAGVEEQLPDSWSGRLHVIVSANIELVKKRGRNHSIPGAPRKSFYEARIHKLYDVRVEVVSGP